MNNFVKGILVGTGVGLLVAPLSGRDTRNLLNRRFNEWRNSLPEDSRVNQYTRQVSDRVSQTKDNLQGYAQQAVSKVKDTSNTFGNKAQESLQQGTSKVRDTTSDMPGNKVKSGSDPTRSGSNYSATRVRPDTDETVSRD